MSRPRRDLDKWRNAVLQHPSISDGCRVLLLVLADYMTADLKVSVDRKELAARLNRSERALGRRFQEAIGEAIRPDNEARADQRRWDMEHRLLDRIVRGQKNTTRSVYQALMPTLVNRTKVSGRTDSLPDTLKPVETDQKCPDENDPLSVERPSLPDTRASCHTSDSPSRAPSDRNKRSDDEHKPTPAASRLTACEWHGYTLPCDDDCANHPTNRERSA